MSNANRPYIALNVGALASIAENTEDPTLLAAIKYELGHRRSRAAKRLLSRLNGSAMPRTAAAPTSTPASERNAIGSNEIGRPTRRSEGRRGFEHAPTDEQEAAVDAFMSGDSLKISAFAGAGKTSTELSAESEPGVVRGK